MNNTTIRRTAALVASSLAIALGGCSSGQQSENFLTWDQINQEYHDTVASYPYRLPTGATFPSDMLKGDSENALYEPGVGAMQAYLFAQCAQEKVAIADKTSNPAAAKTALDAIDQIHQLPVFQQHFDDSGGAWKGVMDKARLGDYSQLSDMYKGDCDDAWHHDNGA